MSHRRINVLAEHLVPSPTANEGRPNGTITFKSVNHVGRATENVDAMVKFYCDVMGFMKITRPDLPFGGAWLRNGTMMLHLIKPSDMAKNGESFTAKQIAETTKEINTFRNNVPGNISDTKAVKAGKFLSGIGHHLAFRVDNMVEAEQHLQKMGVQYYAFDHAKKADEKANSFSQQMKDFGTEKQIFLYDPDGNGLEISNFDDEFPPDDPTGSTVKIGGAAMKN